ncbi:hypothetical protein DPMN_045539 [Dreissena polymorpha]|uniref:Uncharacterized protein n=1 Tax=Dreissena polymorpha TaxID=45954 RepID=A0A9D4I1H2_DREPO|nr:hypothetical protein DPMN_045539 [Dreissena polymorpha]
MRLKAEGLCIHSGLTRDPSSEPKQPWSSETPSLWHRGCTHVQPTKQLKDQS